MSIYDNKLIKLTYINNPKFMELTKEQKDRFIYRYTIVHSRMPFLRNFSIDINKSINEGIINLVKNNRDCLINQLYIDFIENLIINMSGFKYRYRRLSYKDAFTFDCEDDYYKMVNLFVKFWEYLVSEDMVGTSSIKLTKNYKEVYNNNFINLWREYHRILKGKDPFFDKISRYLLIYFLTHNEVNCDYNLYYTIIKKLYYDKTLLDYYRMNYSNNEQAIPSDLIKRYNTNNDKIIR